MEHTNPEQASAEAVHKAKNAAQAIEFAREAQLAKAVEDTALRTKEALLDGLREVFGDGDEKDPDQMKILVRRIPILCASVIQMHEDIKNINGNIKWGVRIVIGAVIVAILKLVLIP